MKIYAVLYKSVSESPKVVKIKADSYEWKAVTSKEFVIAFTAGGKIVAEFLASEIVGFALQEAVV